MAPTGFNLSDPSVTKLFKKKYLPYQQNVANGKNITIAKVKRSQDFVGEEIQKAVDFGWIGGAGAGDIPTANRGTYERATLTPQSLYITYEVDRRTIKQSKDPGAFVEAQKHAVQKTTEKFMWLRSLSLWGEGTTGALGTIDSGGVTDNGSGSYSLVISSATYQRARFEKRDIYNIGTGNSVQFECTAHVPSTRTITVQRIGGGSQVPVAGDILYLQGSENNMPYSIKQALSASSSTLYGVTVQERWQAFQKNAANAGITVDLMNEVMLGVHEQGGESPTAIATSYLQMRRLLDQKEDFKRYVEAGTVKSRTGDFSFNTLVFHSIDGPVPIFVDRFIENDKMYFLNWDYIEIHDTPDSPGWVDDDTGAIWLRKAGKDQFEARYACYTNTMILPNKHGYLYGLA